MQFRDAEDGEQKKFKVFTAWVISSNYATTHHDGNIIH